MASFKIDDSAKLIGKIRFGDNAYAAQGVVLRSEEDSIHIGANSWILENSVIIGTQSFPLEVGRKTVFGHKCIAIGAKIGDLCEIGNGVVMLPGAKIGDMCIFGEGTLIPENTVIPDESVVVGRPGRVIRKLTQEDRMMISRMRGNDISLVNDNLNLIDNIDKAGVKMGKLYAYKDKYPEVAESTMLFEGAEITGDVKIGENCIIASGVKIIGNSHGPVIIGSNVQILENTVLHLLPDNKLEISDNVIIGPGCIIHGTTIGEGSVIESGSILCDYSSIGKNTLVKAGSLVKQRSNFSDNSVLEGFPAKEISKVEGNLTKPEWTIRNISEPF